eukprot:scaffold84667_cov31-Tisochrysis_lutea.AAC.3
MATCEARLSRVANVHLIVIATVASMRAAARALFTHHATEHRLERVKMPQPSRKRQSRRRYVISYARMARRQLPSRAAGQRTTCASAADE